MTRVWLVLLGSWVALVGVFAHRLAVDVGSVTVPWGLLAGWLTTGLVVHACGQWRPVGGAWFAIGWILLLMAERAVGGGSYLIAADALGWSFMVGGLLVMTADVFLTSRIKS